MMELIWLIPLIPLLGFIVNGLGQYNFSKSLIGMVGCGTVLGAFILSCMLFGQVLDARNAGGDASFTYQLFEWISVGGFSLNFSFLLDPLSADRKSTRLNSSHVKIS